MEQFPHKWHYKCSVLTMFVFSYSYCEQFPDERYNPVVRCFRLFLTWKICDTNGAAYQSLRTTLDKYSIFCGRNPVSYWLNLVESTPFECFCDVFTCRYQWWSMLAAVRQEEHPLEWRTRAPSEHRSPGQVCGVAMETKLGDTIV